MSGTTIEVLSAEYKSLKLIRWTKKKIVVVVSSLDDLCPLYLLLYDEESLAQCGIILKYDLNLWDQFGNGVEVSLRLLEVLDGYVNWSS